MSEREYPVTVAVSRADGTIEQVRVGTALRVGDTFQLTFGELSIGATPSASSAPRRAAPSAPAGGGGGLVFPPYGRSKGQPVAGATMQDLEYYASGCRRTLDDPAKSRWHDKERQLLAAIEAELRRQRGGGGDEPPFRDDDGPPPRLDDDMPF